MLPNALTPALLKQLEIFKIRSRRAYLGSRQGGHISPKRGHGIEFADYRRYELGDNPRHIDWGVYARSDKLYIKTFQEEQDLSVLLIIDPSSSMQTPLISGKWQRACDIALALAYVALMEQDSVRVAVPGNWISPKYSGAKAIHQLSAALQALQLKQVASFQREAQEVVAAIKFPGVAILISDLLMEFSEIELLFNLLRSKNLDITAIQLLSQLDESLDGLSDNIRAVDSETGESVELSVNSDRKAQYKFLLAQHNKTVRSYLNGAGIRIIKTSTGDSLAQFLIQQLPQTGLLK